MKRGRRSLSGRAIGTLAHLAFGVVVLLSGCMTPGIDDPARRGPFYAPTNYVAEAQLPSTFRRVIVLPVAAGVVAPAESAAALDPVFLAELQKQNRFEVVTLTREECLRHFRVEELSSAAALPSDFMSLLRKEYAADGVLFIDLTVFKPYRPLAIGVRAKLAVVGPDTRLLWVFDNVFSTTDPEVANAARHHFLETDRRGVPADFTQAVLQSPTRFATYVAAAMFATLPPVNAPVPPVRK